MAGQLALVAFPGDLSSVPGTSTMHLPAACNFSSRDPIYSPGPLGHLYTLLQMFEKASCIRTTVLSCYNILLLENEDNSPGLASPSVSTPHLNELPTCLPFLLRSGDWTLTELMPLWAEPSTQTQPVLPVDSFNSIFCRTTVWHFSGPASVFPCVMLLSLYFVHSEWFSTCFNTFSRLKQPS